MGDDFAGESNLNEDSLENMERIASDLGGRVDDTEVAAVYKAKGFFSSFGLLLREQKSLWPWYLLLYVYVYDICRC